MAASDDLQKAKDALADPRTTSFTYKGKKYTLTQVRDELIPQLEEGAKVESAQKASTEAGARAAGPALADAKSALSRAESALKGAKQKFAAGKMIS